MRVRFAFWSLKKRKEQHLLPPLTFLSVAPETIEPFLTN
jgi:hypothetical protein